MNYISYEVEHLPYVMVHIAKWRHELKCLRELYHLWSIEGTI